MKSSPSSSKTGATLHAAPPTARTRVRIGPHERTLDQDGTRHVVNAEARFDPSRNHVALRMRRRPAFGDQASTFPKGKFAGRLRRTAGTSAWAVPHARKAEDVSQRTCSPVLLNPEDDGWLLESCGRRLQRMSSTPTSSQHATPNRGNRHFERRSRWCVARSPQRAGRRFTFRSDQAAAPQGRRMRTGSLRARSCPDGAQRRRIKHKAATTYAHGAASPHCRSRT